MVVFGVVGGGMVRREDVGRFWVDGGVWRAWTRWHVLKADVIGGGRDGDAAEEVREGVKIVRLEKGNDEL